MEPRATVERVINGGKAKEYYLTGLVENRRSCLHGKTRADLIRQIWRIKIWWCIQFAPRWRKPCLYRFLWFKGVTINDILFIIIRFTPILAKTLC